MAMKIFSYLSGELNKRAIAEIDFCSTKRGVTIHNTSLGNKVISHF